MHTLSQLSFFQKAKTIPQRSISVATLRGEPYFLHILFLFFGLSILGYAYFVGLSIMNVIANKEALTQAEELQNNVAALEQEYFELSKGITVDAAADHGLVKPANVSFVRRDTAFASNIQSNF